VPVPLPRLLFLTAPKAHTRVAGVAQVRALRHENAALSKSLQVLAASARRAPALFLVLGSCPISRFGHYLGELSK
jgi:hypothetical protein